MLHEPTADNIQSFFPFAEFRSDQLEAIRLTLEQFRDGKRFVFIEMPTGGGKSAIAYAVAHFFQTTFWACPQKFLQDQISRDFGQPPKDSLIPVVDLKGRNNYPCTFYERFAAANIRSLLVAMGKSSSDATRATDYIISHGTMAGCPVEMNLGDISKILEIRNKKENCGEGKCKRDGQAKCDECFPAAKSNLIRSLCPYWKRVGEALPARICLMNFKAFLSQTVLTHAFAPRDLLIIDEAHNTEAELMSFISFTLTDKSLRGHGITFPQLSSATEYAKFMKDSGVLDVIDTILEHARLAKDPKTEDEWLDTRRRCTHFLNSAEEGGWVSLFKNCGAWNSIELKPIYVRGMAEDFIFSSGRHILMMSATILSPRSICDSLGIDTSQTYSVRYGSRFPVKNRPIYFMPVGSLSFKHKHKTLPLIVRAVDAILDRYKGKRGIIHTHNFEIARLILAGSKYKGRLLFQQDWASKTEMLKEHAERTDTVIVAPAMHEGLDLKDDLGRFQIIIKVPYPSMKDNPQLEARMKDSQEYYDWLTALKLVQSYGRAVRSETDWAHTYILDADFGWFKKKAEHLLPQWFTDAITNVS
jgi:Rad3-related DNA helicase